MNKIEVGKFKLEAKLLKPWPANQVNDSQGSGAVGGKGVESQVCQSVDAGDPLCHAHTLGPLPPVAAGVLCR